ncbi:HNH endonuclease [Embleya sp. NPDC050493]|uniref:HNH endonuclease n=1 Tax=Embleya sp. NPDC050493 TaxID=3363989 RepID=UPI0037A4F155
MSGSVTPDGSVVPKSTKARAWAWTREELILACAIHVENGWRRLSPKHPQVVELSTLLRAATIHPREGRRSDFRNNGGVSRKTSDFCTAHPDYPQDNVQMRIGGLVGVVLREFLADTEGMLAQARLTKASLPLAVSQPLDPTALGQVPVPRGPVKHIIVRGKRLQRVATRSERIKHHYANACQICDSTMRTITGSTSDGAHIRALKYRGPDHESNILCLCAFCHREFDSGGIYIDDDLCVRDSADGVWEATLSLKDGHTIDRDHLRFHRASFGLDTHPDIDPSVLKRRWPKP